MKNVKTVLVVLFFLAATTNVSVVNCANEKVKVEENAQTAIKKMEKQEATETAADENKSVQAVQYIKDDAVEQKNDTTGQTVKEDISEQKNSGIKVTFIELGSVNCIPCKMMQPVMKAVEEEYGDRVKVVFHDVWTPAGRPYAKKYGIRAIPTQVFLDAEGKEYYRHAGFFPKEELVKILQMKGVD